MIILGLVILTALSGILVLFTDIIDGGKNKIRFVTIQVIVLVLTTILSYISAKRDAQQHDNIEKLEKIDTSIDRHIDSLTIINNKLDTSVQSAVKADTALGNHNLKFAQQSNDLLLQLRQVSENSKSLIKQLDLKTDQEFAVSGGFTFWNKFKIKNTSEISVFYGQQEQAKKPYWNYDGDKPMMMEILNDKVQFYYRHEEILLRGKVYDMKGDIIIEFDMDKWRINKDACSKFNYDNKGLEVFDKSGRIACSLNYVGSALYFQGILNANDAIKILRTDTPYIIIKGVSPESIKSAHDAYDGDPIEQLFVYTGRKWHGVRMSSKKGG